MFICELVHIETCISIISTAHVLTYRIERCAEFVRVLYGVVILGILIRRDFSKRIS